MSTHDRNTWEEFFDAHADVYDENEFTKNTVAEIDFLIEELKIAPGESILDVGCGTGRHAVELARRGYRVTGIDLSTRMLARAAQVAEAAGVWVEWVHGDAANFSMEKEFDAAVCLCEGAFGLLSSAEDSIAQPWAILKNVSGCLKPQARAVFTVLNGAAMLRKYQQKDVEDGRFDPVTMVETSDYAPRGGLPTIRVRERGFVATELSLLFSLAGLSVLNTWGGTAGKWARRKINLDEIEIMIMACKTAEPATEPDRLFRGCG